MYFVYKEDSAILFLKCAQNSLQTLFKITAVFRTCQQGTHVQRVNNTVSQYRRDFTVDNFLCQTFGDCCFTNTGFTNKQRVVLTATAQYLDRTRNLVLSTDEWVDLAKARLFIQINGEDVERTTLCCRCALIGFLGRRQFALAFIRHLGDAVGNKIHYIEAADTLLVQEVNSVGVFLTEHRHEYIGAGDFFFTYALDM